MSFKEFVCLLCIFIVKSKSQSAYCQYSQRNIFPKNVQVTINAAGKNEGELIKTIEYFKRKGDPLKLQAAYFLISNMGIHYSVDYYWADDAGKKIDYREFDFKDYPTALQFLSAQKYNGKAIKPKVITYRDIESVTSAYLIKNIEDAFLVWQNGRFKNVPFKDFCEYILPYRVCFEPLTDWRSSYSSKFYWVRDTLNQRGLEETLSFVATDSRLWFTDMWGKERFKEPLPRLSALQLLFRKEGLCHDIADLEVFTLRSQGLPVALNIIPAWGTASYGHFFNTVFDNSMRPIPLDVSRHNSVGPKLEREPSKVIRLTYSKQPGILASFKKTEDIPTGFMREQNYIDVTHEFWPTSPIKCNLFEPSNANTSSFADIVYACVFNHATWKPIWWSKKTGNTASFENMAKGVVYLPAYYSKGKLIPAGNLVAQGYNNQLVLSPKLDKKHSISIKEDPKYLVFRPGSKYKLYYWQNQWKLAGIKEATIGATSMSFENVPSNALLILIPEYTKSMERPFFYHEDGRQIWL